MVDACFALWLLFTCQSPQRVSLLSRGVERSKDCPAPFRAFVDKGEKNKGRETEVEVEVGSPVGAFAFCFLHFLSIFHLRSPTSSEKGKSERQGFRYAWLLAGLHFASRSRGTSRGHSEIPRKTEDAVERLNGAGFRAVCRSPACSRLAGTVVVNVASPILSFPASCRPSSALVFLPRESSMPSVSLKQFDLPKKRAHESCPESFNAFSKKKTILESWRALTPPLLPRMRPCRSPLPLPPRPSASRSGASRCRSARVGPGAPACPYSRWCTGGEGTVAEERCRRSCSSRRRQAPRTTQTTPLPPRRSPPRPPSCSTWSSDSRSRSASSCSAPRPCSRSGP